MFMDEMMSNEGTVMPPASERSLSVSVAEIEPHQTAKVMLPLAALLRSRLGQPRTPGSPKSSLSSPSNRMPRLLGGEQASPKTTCSTPHFRGVPTPCRSNSVTTPTAGSRMQSFLGTPTDTPCLTPAPRSRQPSSSSSWSTPEASSWPTPTSSPDDSPAHSSGPFSGLPNFQNPDENPVQFPALRIPSDEMGKADADGGSCPVRSSSLGTSEDEVHQNLNIDFFPTPTFSEVHSSNDAEGKMPIFPKSQKFPDSKSSNDEETSSLSTSPASSKLGSASDGASSPEQQLLRQRLQQLQQQQQQQQLEEQLPEQQQEPQSEHAETTAPDSQEKEGACFYYYIGDSPVRGRSLDSEDESSDSDSNSNSESDLGQSEEQDEQEQLRYFAIETLGLPPKLFAEADMEMYPSLSNTESEHEPKSDNLEKLEKFENSGMVASPMCSYQESSLDDFVREAKDSLSKLMPPQWQKWTGHDGRVCYTHRITDETVFVHPSILSYKRLLNTVLEIRAEFPLEMSDALRERRSSVETLLKELRTQAEANLSDWSGPYRCQYGEYYHNPFFHCSTWLSPALAWETELSMTKRILEGALLHPVRAQGEFGLDLRRLRIVVFAIIALQRLTVIHSCSSSSSSIAGSSSANRQQSALLRRSCRSCSCSSDDVDMMSPEIISQIDWDIPRTNGRDVELGATLGVTRSLLLKYAAEDPEVGYCQGMNFVAALFAVASRSSEEAYERFFAFTQSMRGLWLPGFPLLMQGIDTFKSLASTRPWYRHLSDRDIQPDMYLPRAWMGLFSKWLPLPTRVLMLRRMEGSGLSYMLAVSLALLDLRLPRLLQRDDMDELLHVLDALGRSDLDVPALWLTTESWMPLAAAAVQSSLEAPRGSTFRWRKASETGGFEEIRIRARSGSGSSSATTPRSPLARRLRKLTL